MGVSVNIGAATNSRKNAQKNTKTTGGELICKNFGVNGNRKPEYENFPAILWRGSLGSPNHVFGAKKLVCGAAVNDSASLCISKLICPPLTPNAQNWGCKTQAML